MKTVYPLQTKFAGGIIKHEHSCKILYIKKLVLVHSILYGISHLSRFINPKEPLINSLYRERILGECLLKSSLPGKALRMHVDITRLAERFNMHSQSRAW